ncbi:hypothetical protein D9758_000318 [Tetrapyrgos nigripes]|uniref:Peroxisomal membrane protein PEX16 n=1 Tax=Tetrapyrgos nigripes TaxID=182062 RepID=A0A8H5LZB8_9AGAR|nr:hypothetical protein D9758_000318 [Tetrapyrgos nigripes]
MSSSIASYESFLLNNVSTISTVESSLRSLTWFLPGRFKDAELASEALSAALNMISMYHDTLLTHLSQSDPKLRSLIPPSLHTRFTKAWMDKNSIYKWAGRMLEVIRYTELVIEMGLRRKVSSRTRWKGIILLEIIKAFLRLLLLRITRRPLLSAPIPEREFDPTTIPPSNETSPTLAPSSPRISAQSTPDHLKNNHVPLEPHPLLTTPPLPSESAESLVEDYLLPKALNTSSVKPSFSLLRPLSSSQDWASEVIYILRPLVYAILISRNRRTNTHLVTILIMEVISRTLRRNPPPSSVLERSEYARRDRDILWYLFRGSIWDSYTRPKLEAIADKISNTPLLGIFGVLLNDWIPLINEYHYYTAP